MSQLIKINNSQIERLVYHDEPVATISMIATVHGISEDTVAKSFQRNKERFVEGKHVYRLDFYDASQLGLSVQVSPNGLTLFTRKGYALLTKPMRDTKSWEVQEEMIDEYFTLKDTTSPLPVVHDPAMAMLIDMAYQHDAALHELACLKAEQERQDKALIAHQAQVIEALSVSQRAENKADIALQDSSYLTVEEFIGRNGLLHQFPHTQHRAIADWVKNFCAMHGLAFHRDDVIGKSWETENHYPIQALLAYVRYAQRKPRQIALVRQEQA